MTSSDVSIYTCPMLDYAIYETMDMFNVSQLGKTCFVLQLRNVPKLSDRYSIGGHFRPPIEWF